MSKENQSGTDRVALWNPNAAAIWSLLFSPVFGAWLHAKNWTALGNETKARHSMYWVYGGIAVLVLTAFLPEAIARGVGYGLLFGWYFSFATQQMKYVKKTLGGTYEKKGWTKPLGIAAASLATFFLVVGVAAVSFNPDFQREIALSEISGVWQASKDGSMVRFRLEGEDKSVDINDQSFPVSVEGYDAENDRLTLVVDGEPSVIWSVRKVVANDGGFTLKFTLQNGIQDELWFVEKL